MLRLLHKDLIFLIINYLEGDHLKNFKLCCKLFKEITKNKSCAIEITLGNIERTSSTPGYHIIKTNDGEEIGLCFYIEFNRDRFYSEIKHLIIDHNNKNSYISSYQIFLNAFENLQSLKITRCIGDVILRIDDSHVKFSSLEIYTTRFIKLFLHKKLEKARLCSLEEWTKNHANITIELPSNEFLYYALEIKYYARRSAIEYGNGTPTFINHPLHIFIPNLAYLV